MKSTAIANSNIAFVKYWGKKDEFRNIPMNPSLSMTLDENISTTTTVEFSETYNEDLLILNNEKYDDNKLIRVSNFLDLIRAKANINLRAKVVSINTFPTGSGIASSASGFAALAAASSRAAGLVFNKKKLSALAKLGSGSATRSIYGGFVEWEGEYAIQLKNEHYWHELRDVIVMVSDKEKKIGSREGMKATVETSNTYKIRMEKIRDTFEKTKKAILNKEFNRLAKLIMYDSDNMHECMEDTTPSLNYLNNESQKIINIVKKINKKEVKAAYSFDAGPNAHIITLEKNIEEIKKELLKVFGIQIIVSRPGQGVRYKNEHLF